MANALNKVKTSGVEDDAISLAKMAPGTDGQVITYDASGNPVAVGPGTDGQVLTSTGAGSPPAFETLPTSGATLSGSTDNTVVTVTGANAMQGEANLTFDGTYLGAGVTPAANEGRIQAKTNDNIVAKFTRNNTGNYSGAIQFGNNDRIWSIYGSGTKLGLYNQTGSQLGLEIDSSSHDVKIEAGNLVIGTAGKGILFDSHSAAHNLNDYEEGTFTATMGHSVTLTQSTLTYTKVGRMVHICGLLSVNDDNAHSHFTLQNLPFTAGAGYADLSCPATRINNWNVSTDTSWISGYTESNKIYFQQVRDNATATACEADSGGDMIINLTYFAA